VPYTQIRISVDNLIVANSRYRVIGQQPGFALIDTAELALYPQTAGKTSSALAPYFTDPGSPADATYGPTGAWGQFSAAPINNATVNPTDIATSKLIIQSFCTE
jgi:hypothetical protein